MHDSICWNIKLFNTCRTEECTAVFWTGVTVCTVLAVLLSVILCSDTVATEQCEATSSLLRVLVLIYKVSVIVWRTVDEGQYSCWLLVTNKRRHTHGALHVGSHDNTLLSFISVPNFRTAERLLLLLLLHSYIDRRYSAPTVDLTWRGGSYTVHKIILHTPPLLFRILSSFDALL